MSTTLPELPEPPSYVSAYDDAPLTDHYSAGQMHAYGLAVWKAAMEQAAQQAGDRAKQVRAANTRRGNISAAAILAVDQLEFLASVLRRLPLPEQGSPQERRE